MQVHNLFCHADRFQTLYTSGTNVSLVFLSLLESGVSTMWQAVKQRIKKAQKRKEKPWEQLTERGKLRRLRKSPYYQEYMQERKRIQRLTRKLERKGYQPVQDTLPPVPKKLTGGSVRVLQKRTEKYIKDRSDFIALTGTDEYQQGEVIKEAKVKKRRTKREAIRQAEEHLQQQKEQQGQDEQQDFERKRRKLDKAQRERLERDREYQEQLRSAKLAEERLYDFFDSMESDNRSKVAYLRQLADEHPEGLGNRIIENPDIFSAIEQVIDSDGKGSGAGSAAWTRVVQVISGTSLSAAQAKQVSDKYEKDLAYNFDPDEQY